MNKILLCLIALIIFSSNPSSEAATYRKQSFPANQPEAIPVEKSQNRSTSHPADWVIPFLSDSLPQHDHKKHQESFNYDRLVRRRHRFFWIFLVKMILLLLHVCTLVGATLHLMHVS